MVAVQIELKLSTFLSKPNGKTTKTAKPGNKRESYLFHKPLHSKGINEAYFF